MVNLLKFFLRFRLKCLLRHKKNSGFTLIELLVAMVLAALIITPLLGFMIDVMNTERKEQAKTTSEQEVQAAADFITRDLQQAVYIYDDKGVERVGNDGDPLLSGIKNQIPPDKVAPACDNATNCKPVLVFWKREFVRDSIGVSSATDSTAKDDGFAYSLVAYYLISNPNSVKPWSPGARIARFQIRGQVNSSNANTEGKKIDAGFNRPPLDSNIKGSTLSEKMNQWKADTAAYKQQVTTLLDYISASGSPVINCPPGSRGVGNNTSGFYTCVNADEVIAQVFIRGNAALRINQRNPDNSYFPSTNIRVQGRGYLSPK